jgi:hypothetical protein
MVLLRFGEVYWKGRSETMQLNVGGIDRVVRVVLGVALIGWGVYAQSWWGVIGVPLLLSGLIGVCPAYKLLGISTCKIKQH